MAPTVVIAYDVFGDVDVEEAALHTFGADVVHSGHLDTPAARAAAAQADALMVMTAEVRAPLIERMGRCRIISRVGTGLDAIDIDAATAHGIWVTYVPDYSVDEVSSHAIALLLAHARRLPQLFELAQHGDWDVKTVGGSIQRLTTQTLGLVGFGRIGRAVAAKAYGLGMNVIAYDPYVDPSALEGTTVQSVDWETLLHASDFVSLHVPLTERTRHIIDAAALAQMKPTAYLINTARGALIDAAALLAAVRAGQIAGAALDVLAEEPAAPDHPLLREPAIIVTPHAAWCSEQAFREVRARAAQEVVRVLRGQEPRVPANEIDADARHPRR